MRLDRFFPITGESDFNSRIGKVKVSLCVVFNEHRRVGCSLTFFGGHKAVVRPDPFPNSAVKRSLADGSGFIDSARVGCRQIFLKRRTRGFGVFVWRMRSSFIPIHPAGQLRIVAGLRAQKKVEFQTRFSQFRASL